MTDKKATIINFTAQRTTSLSKAESVFFNRKEFETILNLYGKMVASGHWKDYAIDSGREDAIFSVYRHSHDRPLYQIIKTPKRASKQGAYRIASAQGKIVKRGHDIDRLLRYFDKALIKLIR